MILPDNPDAHERAARLVASGGVLAFRTDTFYGLGADPFDPRALQAVNDLKGRDGKPILVLLSDRGAAARLLERPPTHAYTLIAAKLWPAPLTLVAKARPDVSELLTAGTGTVGVRLPEDEEVRALVRACGGALTATSANPAGLPPARTAQEAADYFGGRLELVVDGGPSRGDLPSTVLDVSGSPARLVREGALSKELLAKFLGDMDETLIVE
ncbi:MAG TPA: L-threonylcarbamoyladenylate synthase [Pyrinomonadaceae bacterium]|nr:L-threonylcarbamoyladenylate synthase [Pyrinomonadaceae bacterium]